MAGSGWFWGRADRSTTPAEDDRLGKIMERRLLAMYAETGGPPQHQDWVTNNIRDYYAFRWTSDKTPGVLVELGVGWGADKDFLRANVDRIAQTLADSIAEFAGISEGDQMTREQFDLWFDEQYRKYGVASTFDALKQIQATQQAQLTVKSDIGHSHNGTVTVK